MKRKPKIEYEETFCIDLDLHIDATPEERFRWDFAIVAITYFLFSRSIGCWGGRETCMTEPTDGFWHCNYWYCLQSARDVVEVELPKIISGFTINGCSKLTLGIGGPSEEDYAKEFQQEEKMEWVWFKEDLPLSKRGQLRHIKSK